MKFEMDAELNDGAPEGLLDDDYDYDYDDEDYFVEYGDEDDDEDDFFDDEDDDGQDL